MSSSDFESILLRGGRKDENLSFTEHPGVDLSVPVIFLRVFDAHPESGKVMFVLSDSSFELNVKVSTPRTIPSKPGLL